MSARKAHYQVHLVDCFNDRESLEIASSAHKLDCDHNNFDLTVALGYINDIVKRHPKLKIIIGSGLEAYPSPLEILAPHNICANSVEQINTLRQPSSLIRLFEDCQIPHAKIRIDHPNCANKYLIKHVGGMGGGHVQWYYPEYQKAHDAYFQEYLEGQTASVVFLSDGQQFRIVGYNYQWASTQIPSMPFVRGDICTTTHLSSHQAGIKKILQALIDDTHLQGLCGMDYIVLGDGAIKIIEINPRPPASFELHETDYPLFATHIACFNGELKKTRLTTQKETKGSSILYADKTLHIENNISWPDWCADRPHAGDAVKKHQPVCTIYAKGDTLSRVRTKLARRREQIQLLLTTQ